MSNDKYNKIGGSRQAKYDKTKKKMDEVRKRSKDRKSKMVTASDRPYSQKLLERTKAMLGMKSPLAKRDDVFGDMKNKELYELGKIYKEGYGNTRASATPIGMIEDERSRREELARRRNLEKNLEFVDPIIKMGEPTGYDQPRLLYKGANSYSEGKKVKKKPAKKIRGVGIARKGVRKCKMR
tara:strand:- start:720 stop:1265 length:546 start_codon:yes stop_codon:yes gene_type:complete